MIVISKRQSRRNMYFAAITVTLVLIGFILGCAYLLSLRSGKTSMSVVELSQCIKTVHLFVVVICYLLNNRELVEFSAYQSLHIQQCHIKEVTNEMLLGTLPATVTVLAIIRLRVCLCKGNATKLVSKRFVVILYSLEILGSIFLWALLQTPELFISKDRFIDRILQNETSKDSFISLDNCYMRIHKIHYNVLLYKWANIILCYILPVVIGICIYAKIIMHVYQSATRVQMHAGMAHPSTSISLIPASHQPFTRSATRLSNGYRHATNIHRSILGIVTGIFFSWVPTCVVKVVSLLSNENISNLYKAELHLVLVIFVIFPFEEGIYQTDKRKRLFSIFKRVLGKTSQNSLQEGVRHEVIIIPQIETGENTLLASFEESNESTTEENGAVKHLSVPSSKISSRPSLSSEKCQRTSIRSFGSVSSASLYSRRRGLMVPSLSLSTSTDSENSSVFIISTPLSVDEHSPYLSSNGSFSPLFIKVNREKLSPDSRNLSEPFTCTPYSIRTFSFGSTLSFDCQESIGSGRRTSISRARSKWRSFQRKISSSLKYNVPDHSFE